MIRGNDLEKAVYEPEHIQKVLSEIGSNFPRYFQTFAEQSPETRLADYIKRYDKERKAYREYVHHDALDEFEDDPGAFKGHTHRQCTIIRNCLWSRDEVMKSYKESFARVTGRQLLSTVRNIAQFGVQYFADFDDQAHEAAATYSDLGLEPLNEPQYQCGGVIGYGIQSSLLYGVRARCFAHRSQNAVWSLYFLSGSESFDLQDGSEFMMIRPKQGTCEQNFFYPSELFGFYALRVFLILKSACQDLGITFDRDYRYTYLSAFCDHVAETHRADIDTFRWSSDHVERQPWF
jgi:hypothetical protein